MEYEFGGSIRAAVGVLMQLIYGATEADYKRPVVVWSPFYRNSPWAFFSAMKTSPRDHVQQVVHEGEDIVAIVVQEKVRFFFQKRLVAVVTVQTTRKWIPQGRFGHFADTKDCWQVIEGEEVQEISGTRPFQLSDEWMSVNFEIDDSLRTKKVG